MMSTLPDGVLLKLLPEAVYAALTASDKIMAVYRSGNFEVNLKSDSTPLTVADRESHETIRQSLLRTRIPMLSEEGRMLHFDERKNWELFWLVDPLDGTKEFIKVNDEFTVNIALIENGRSVLGVVVVPAARTLYFGLRGQGAFKIDGYSFDGSIEECEFDVLRPAANRLPLSLESRRFTVVGSRSHMAPEMADYFEKLRKMHSDMEVISKGSSLKICMVAEGKADVYPRITPTTEWDTAAGQAIAELAGMELVDMHSHEPLIYNKESLINPPFVVRAPGVEVPII